MTGAATTAQWLTSAAIGTGGGGIALALLKLALDDGPGTVPRALAAVPQTDPSAEPAEAEPRHARPPHTDETQPLIRYQSARARHSKGPAVTWT